MRDSHPFGVVSDKETETESVGFPILRHTLASRLVVALGSLKQNILDRKTLAN